MIEEDPTAQNEIAEALAKVDPKAQVISFTKSQDFLAWMLKIQAHEPDVQPPVPQDRFLGLITSITSWRFRDLRLIGKFKALFVQRGFAKTEAELFVIFTSYESPNFRIKRYEYRSVNNVVFKPFDKVVLEQVLQIAFEGAKPLKSKVTHTQKSDAEIEMLKEIRLTAIGELGFRTVANQQIEVGSIAKYYADFLATPHHRSALAQTVTCTPTSDKSLWNIELRFYALDQIQTFNIQNLARKGNGRRTLPGPGSGSFEFVFVEFHGSSNVQDVRPTLERFYDHKMTTVPSLTDLDRHMESAHHAANCFLFIDHSHLAGNELQEIERLRTTWKDRGLSIFVLSSKFFDERFELELSSHCEDIYYAPFNRSYIAKGLKLKWPELHNREELYETFHVEDQLLHVSNPVQLIEVSEAGLVIDYHREIHLGSFREFHFTMPNELEVPPLVAQCIFTRPVAEKKERFECHFAFFGIRDHELKFIRRWMLNRYVGEKSKE